MNGATISYGRRGEGQQSRYRMENIFMFNTIITCCRDCTPETGRAVHGKDGRNCHEYCERYLAEKQSRDREVNTASTMKRGDKELDECLHTTYWKRGRKRKGR